MGGYTGWSESLLVKQVFVGFVVRLLKIVLVPMLNKVTSYNFQPFIKRETTFATFCLYFYTPNQDYCSKIWISDKSKENDKQCRSILMIKISRLIRIYTVCILFCSTGLEKLNRKQEKRHFDFEGVVVVGWGGVSGGGGGGVGGRNKPILTKKSFQDVFFFTKRFCVL